MPKLFLQPNSLKPEVGPVDKVMSWTAWEQAGSFSALRLWLRRKGESMARAVHPTGRLNFLV